MTDTPYNTVHLTGRLLDPAGRPLTGRILCEPIPEYVLEDGETDRRLWAGAVETHLDEQGRISLHLMPERYKLKFQVTTAAGLPANIHPVTVELRADAQLPALLWDSATEAEQPNLIDRLIVLRREPGEIVVSTKSFTAPKEK